MKKLSIPYAVILIFLIFSAFGCIPASGPTPEETAREFIDAKSEGAIDKEAKAQKKAQEDYGQLPVRFQRPAYMLERPKVTSAAGPQSLDEFSLPVGADISTPAGPKPLGTIISQIAAMKNMSVSYATDVDQNALISVNIRASQDFFKAVDNILRPLDYFYELQEDTLIIKHKETKKFHIAMPFITSTYATGVGGNVLGSTDNNNMDGTLSINSSGNTFDIWANIQGNLDKILEIWTAPPATSAPAPDSETADSESESTTSESENTTAAVTIPQRPAGRGYYTIDKPIGLITVTAPNSLLGKIETYLENLKSEIYRQVAIEAKIVEVTLSEDNTTGIDWSQLLGPDSGGFDVGLDMSKTGIIKTPAVSDGSYPSPAKTGVQLTPWSFLTMGFKSFNLVIDAMKEQGHVEVLSNPKVSVMNGQPAMISVGENVTYVDSVESTVDEGIISYTVNTSSVMSGLGMGVIATIMEGNQIILSITPVTTNLTQPIEYRSFGDNQVGLPVVNLREMNTIVRVKDGELLIVGGLIDEASAYDNDKVAGLGDIPLAGKFFKTDGTAKVKKELIILMRPKIISM